MYYSCITTQRIQRTVAFSEKSWTYVIFSQTLACQGKGTKDWCNQRLFKWRNLPNHMSVEGDNKKVKSPFNCGIFPLTQPHVANKQTKKKNSSIHSSLYVFWLTMRSQIESIRSTQYTPLYWNKWFDSKSSQWRQLQLLK